MYDCSQVTLSLRLTGGHVLFVLYLDSTVVSTGSVHRARLTWYTIITLTPVRGSDRGSWAVTHAVSCSVYRAPL